MRCFVDTSAFLAVLNRSDQYHSRAAALWERLLLDLSAESITTNYVLVETIALIQRRLGLGALRSFSTDVVPILQVIWIDRASHEKGMSSLVSQSRGRLSLVDCSSFEVMRHLGIRKFFAFDRDFAEQGFRSLESASGSGDSIREGK